jgi:Ser/Thr protein kinase RdoA (MazF antagonist)
MSSDMDADLTLQASEVLEFWSVGARQVEPVTIGVNRRVWRTELGFLTTSWPDERAMAEAELALCQQVAATPAVRFEVPSPIPADGGRLIVDAFDRIWWITHPVTGERPDPTALETLLAVSESLAEVHGQLRRVDQVAVVQPRRLIDWVPLAAEFLEQHPDLFQPAQRDSIAVAVRVVGDRDRELSQGEQLVHGDPSFPNLLVDPASKRIVGILDWQEAAIDSVLADLSVLGNTIWQRSGLPNRRSALDQCIDRYASQGGRTLQSPMVLIAMLAAKLQSVVHHGSRYVAGRGSWDNLAEQPALIQEILTEIGV